MRLKTDAWFAAVSQLTQIRSVDEMTRSEVLVHNHEES